MNIETEVLALFEEGNPIPDLNGLDPIDLDAAAYLATLEQRSSTVTQIDTRNKGQKEQKSIRPWLVAAGIIIIAGLAFVVFSQAGQTPVAGQPGSPDAVLTEYAEARNALDLEGVMALYAEDAIMTNQPLIDGGTRTGIPQIRGLESRTHNVQGLPGDWQVVDVEVSGNIVTFSHRFRNAGGECFSGTGNQITVENGLITIYHSGQQDDTPICP